MAWALPLDVSSRPEAAQSRQARPEEAREPRPCSAMPGRLLGLGLWLRLGLG